MKAFQKDAKTKYRKKGNETKEVETTYQGQVTGVISDAEKEEIKIWKKEGYKRPVSGHYGGHILQMKDSDKSKTWGGIKHEETGAFVNELQQDIF